MLTEDHRPAQDADFMKKDMAKLGWKVDSHKADDQEVLVTAKPPSDMRWPQKSLSDMWGGEYRLSFLGNGVRFTLKSGYNPHSAVHNAALQGDSKGPGLGMIIAERCSPGKTIEEGLSTRTIISSNPGLEWRIEKEEDGYRLLLVHKPSSQLVWSSLNDLVPSEKVASSITSLDRVFKETHVNFDTQDTKSIAAPLTGALGMVKKIRRPVGQDVVYFGEATDADLKAVEDRLQAALNKGIVSDKE